jgi:hypothetical protein
MNLREDWNKAYKFISVQAIAILAAVQSVWPSIPEDMKSSLPHDFIRYMTYILLTIAVYGVMTKQTNLGNKQ